MYIYTRLTHISLITRFYMYHRGVARRFHAWHHTFIRVTWLMCVQYTIYVYECDMTHSYGNGMFHSHLVRDNSMCDMTHSRVWHDSFIRVTWIIHMRDMTPSCVWNDSFMCDTCICVTWLIYTWHETCLCVWLFYMCDITSSCVCDMTHSYVGHDSFVCVTWLIYMCDMTVKISCGVLWIFWDLSVFCLPFLPSFWGTWYPK